MPYAGDHGFSIEGQLPGHGSEPREAEPTNAWNVTKAEYLEAKRREADMSRSKEDRDAYYQVVRFYLGMIFYRDIAEKGVQLIRNS